MYNAVFLKCLSIVVYMYDSNRDSLMLPTIIKGFQVKIGQVDISRFLGGAVYWLQWPRGCYIFCAHSARHNISLCCS